MTHSSVTLTRRTRLTQALKNAGIENPAAVTRLAVSGTMTDDDFAYIRENMHETLHRLDLREASVRKNKIPDGAFNNCRALSAVFIPDTATEIGDCIFNMGNRMRSFTIPTSVVKIAGSAFTCCEVATLTIPETVKEIEDCAFNHCAITSSLVFPASVTDISHRKFYDCYLTDIVVHPDNPVYTSENGKIKRKRVAKEIIVTKTLFDDVL